MKNYSNDIANSADVKKTAEDNARELGELSTHMESMCEAIESHDNSIDLLTKHCNKLQKNVDTKGIIIIILCCASVASLGGVISLIQTAG